MAYKLDDVAKAAYTAYRRSLEQLRGSMDQLQGVPSLEWEALPPALQDAWRNASRAGFSAAIEQMIANGNELTRHLEK